MKLSYVLFFVGLWKLRENSKNYIVNMLNTGKFSAFEEHNIYNALIGYWEEEDGELIITTNESKIYKAANLHEDLNITGNVGYGFDNPDYLHNFELIPIYRNKSQIQYTRVLKPASSFFGNWMLERPMLTAQKSIKKIKINNKRIFTKINNKKIYNFPIINLIKLNKNGTWTYGTSDRPSGKWDVYIYSTSLNFNKAFRENNTGENIWLKKDNLIFLGENIQANNTKINCTEITGDVDCDYTPGVYISRWYSS